MMTYIPQSDSQNGFTVVEVIVTVIIVSLFVVGFFQSYLLLESQRVGVSRQAVASDLAYSNLRGYVAVPAGATCDSDGVDLLNIGQGTAPKYITNQTVKAYPVNGCSDTDNDGANDDFTDNFVKIESTVTYDNGKKISHANYVR